MKSRLMLAAALSLLAAASACHPYQGVRTRAPGQPKKADPVLTRFDYKSGPQGQSSLVLGLSYGKKCNYTVLFGGTIGGMGTNDTDILLEDGWTYVAGKFEESGSKYVPWPIIMTKQVSIGAEGTIFLVQTPVDSAHPLHERVFFLDKSGEHCVHVWPNGSVSKMVDLKPPQYSHFVDIDGSTGTVVIGQPQLIPTVAGDAIKQFVDAAIQKAQTAGIPVP